MTPTIAIIFALAIAAWALVWWDIARRRHGYDERVLAANGEVTKLQIQQDTFEAMLNGHSRRFEALEKNPATMAATKERMDVLEKAWANFRDQAISELEQMRARTMTLTDVKARRFGAGTRPNG